MSDEVAIYINKVLHKFEEHILKPDDFRNAAKAPDGYEVWLIRGTPDPEGQLPLDDEQVTGPTEIKEGQNYRVVPPGTFGT